MGSKRFKLTTSAGDTFELDSEDAAFDAMDELDKMGMKFKVDGIKGAPDAPPKGGPIGVVEIGKPEVIKTTVVDDKPASALSPETERRAADAAPSNPESEGPSWIRGLLGGGWSKPTQEDKGLAQERGDRLEADGSMQGGRDYVAALNDPLKFGKLLGGAGLNFAGQAIGGAGAASANLARTVGAAGLGSAVSDVGHQMGEDDGFNPYRTLAAGGLGAAIAGVPAAVSGVARGLSGASDWVGTKLRGVAYGGGKELTDEVVRDAERLVPPTLKPRTREQYGQAFDAAKDRIWNGELTPQMDQATREGLNSQVDARPIVTELTNRQARVGSNPAAGSEAAARAYDEILNRGVWDANLHPNPGGVGSIQALQAAKSAWDKGAKYVGGEASEALRAQANKDAADVARDQLYRVMDQSTVGPQFRQSMGDYGTASAVANAASDQTANQAIGGLGQSLPSSLSGAAMNLASRTYGPDVLASAARGLSSLTGGIGTAAGYTARVGAAAAPEVAERAFGQRTPQTDANAQSQHGDDSQGNKLNDNIERLLKTNPGAFGPYAKQFDGMDHDELSAVAERLAQHDPAFKRNVWPLLNGSSNR